MNAARRARWLLSAGALLGVALAARGVLAPHPSSELPANAVAVVGAVPVLRSDYERELTAIATERRDGAQDPALRRHVLSRLIDEATLVDRALSLGLALSEPRARSELTSAMIDAVLAGDDPPRATLDEPAMRAYYAQHTGDFSAGGRVHAARLLFSGEASESRARAALARCQRGEPLDALRAGTAVDVSPPPEGPVPIGVLTRYVGPALAELLSSAPVRSCVGPLALGEGVYALGYVFARGDADPPPFEQVRDAVERELRRRDDESRLRRWLDARRAELSVAVARDVR